ncbi:MAG TPA: efflux RND transporter permease subunit, partial [Pirellulales bacterium]|nr:efflux RND transporter permease subunit [Pirellulales bacterium]
VETVVSQLGRPESGTDPTGFYSAEFFIPLKPFETWEPTVPRQGWRKLFGGHRARTKVELIREMNAELSEALPGVNWNFSQVIRDNVLEVLSGVLGENSVKIIGPELAELEKLGKRVVAAMSDVRGIKDVGLYRIMGQTSLELPIDRQKCSLWNISVADALNVVETAIGGKVASTMIEGEKTFDITLRWPKALRADETAILDIPVDVTDHVVTGGSTGDLDPTTQTGAGHGVSSIGSVSTMPSPTGSQITSAEAAISMAPRERIRDLITPQATDLDGQLDPKGRFVRPGASMIAREMGMRQIAVKFSVRERDLAGAVAEAQQRVEPLIPLGYRAEWSGEFQQMKEGEHRLKFIIPVSLVLIFLLHYMAFNSVMAAVVVLVNVVELSLGGLWALWLTDTHFSISAAVGFTSVFGLAVMDGLLLVSSFDQLRSQGVPLFDAILQGAERRVRAVMMTALTAIFGLLPAAISTKIGAQNQKPLAIVIVGSMITVLFLTRYLMPVLYSFYAPYETPKDEGMVH